MVAVEFVKTKYGYKVSLESTGQIYEVHEVNENGTPKFYTVCRDKFGGRGRTDLCGIKTMDEAMRFARYALSDYAED